MGMMQVQWEALKLESIIYGSLVELPIRRVVHNIVAKSQSSEDPGIPSLAFVLA